jgi:hypothetical protein
MELALVEPLPGAACLARGLDVQHAESKSERDLACTFRSGSPPI